MLASVRELWKARRGRRAAIAAIAPFVEGSRTRLNGIPEDAWIAPYMIGFLLMLITLIAKREIDDVDQSSLALAQCEAWTEITGLDQDLMCERVLSLCTIEHKEFELGCRNAHVFSEALSRSTIDGLDETVGAGDVPPAQAWNPGEGDLLTSSHHSILRSLWLQYFETQALEAGLPLSR